ncbi:hypothetical protein AURDEDRAFT_178779 [Auricularia subglabra TFB-10046 SS5]|uniref:Endonuclease/exonuclease/phosphatase domain-containing protein n=1 Tax=Auricularia subglabra (strain TFB-10046 / SS5) TaxID=717982 RepID=J0CPS7_AURST|nr:hypothetical protein AURDEDRAFT_178779 [Auricularia subglabra TFB-10046 SS5]
MKDAAKASGSKEQTADTTGDEGEAPAAKPKKRKDNKGKDAPHYSVKEPAGYYPILPVQVVPAAERPRVFAYASSTRRDFEVFNRYDLSQDLDFLILEIRQGSHSPFLLVLMYNQDAPDDTQQRGRSFERFKALALPDMPIVIAMDANEHHPLWEREKL